MFLLFIINHLSIHQEIETLFEGLVAGAVFESFRIFVRVNH